MVVVPMKDCLYVLCQGLAFVAARTGTKVNKITSNLNNNLHVAISIFRREWVKSTILNETNDNIKI